MSWFVIIATLIVWFLLAILMFVIIGFIGLQFEKVTDIAEIIRADGEARRAAKRAGMDREGDGYSGDDTSRGVAER